MTVEQLRIGVVILCTIWLVLFILRVRRNIGTEEERMEKEWKDFEKKIEKEEKRRKENGSL